MQAGNGLYWKWYVIFVWRCTCLIFGKWYHLHDFYEKNAHVICMKINARNVFVSVSENFYVSHPGMVQLGQVEGGLGGAAWPSWGGGATWPSWGAGNWGGRGSDRIIDSII